ncbi:TKL protein kinase [Saprolegnia parasitica CBS 223.65]|uniref:TKL protein kinase n=1 Tax=Saprolegnia parasitica (strain CBS 223.65) TaxID=695850 RepID=A0A067BUX5_SAPPC|nr:TKL protein kinase [Saprolegnia parasitica CBS 223.65]KDO18081.1 TKL protein kinase [Saprolegnia parasitica CBS 223.65]|eukprot:XP_012211207.1 TKL protein kinase [Saprolegnia parasitica CBS 223.65]
MGMYKNKRVAIKSAKNRHAVRDLLAEIDAIQTCNSPYLIELIAASEQYSDYPKLPKLVLEYMDGGDLHQYLDKKRKGEPVPFDYSTLDIAWVIANALADLHRNGFMHRDLKSRNVLLSSTNYIKVADFGLTREIDPNMTVGAGTCAWIAPEVFGESGSYDYAADIYSFGVILTELETLQEPYAGMTRYDITAGVRSGRLRPSVSSNCAPWFKELVDDCLSFDPTKRPTPIAIIDSLLLQKSTDLLQKPLSSREGTSMALTHSGSSSSTSSMSSSSSRAMSSRIPCPVCKTRHAASLERCSKCGEMLPDASAKLTLLLKRAEVANAKGFSVDLSIECDCETTNAMTAATCSYCGRKLPNDAEKLRILVRRLDLAISAA